MLQFWTSAIWKVLTNGVAASWAQAAIYLATLFVLIAQIRILIRQARSQEDAVRLQTEAIRSGEAARIHQVLVDILMDYRSPEMLLAVRTLWDLWRSDRDGFVERYETQRKREADAIAALPPEKRLEAERASLHFHRRLVSQFYSFVAGLYELGIIPKRILYTHWGEADLRIIPQILLPIEERLGEALGTSPGSGPTLRRLQKLYDDSRSGEPN
jgi:hypothetical protein